MKAQTAEPSAAAVVPTGELLQLRPDQVRPNPSNPRLLFDPQPLQDLKENIRLHGVLVPITVYPLPASDKFGILDGARRHRCCVELEQEGLEPSLPANVVKPPDMLAGLLYMFSIHNFREQWELMPTALSLKIVIDQLGESDSKRLVNLTGLSEPQIERCKKLLLVPQRFQELSLDPNPKTRIPSNFWIEALPVVSLVSETLPELYETLGYEGVLDAFVAKYRAKKIKSVIHFRRIIEASEVVDESIGLFRERLDSFVTDSQVETRAAFDEFIVDTRRVQGAVRACETFTQQIERANIVHAVDERPELMDALRRVRIFVSRLLERLEGSDPPESLTMRGNSESDE